MPTINDIGTGTGSGSAIVDNLVNSVEVPEKLTANQMIDTLMVRINDHYTNVLWESKHPMWDDMIDIGLALAAVFSLFVVGKIAYKAMVLEDERLDIMKLWRPIAVSFVLANWYVITTVLYSISIPFENFFKHMYDRQNVTIIELQKEREAKAKALWLKSLEEESMALVGQRVEDMALEHTEENEDGEEGEETVETAQDIYLGTYGELTTEESEPNPKVDIDKVMSAMRWQHKIESFIMWVGETVWASMILALFLVRALYITVLVMFGPIWIAASVLPVWEDAWATWLGKFVSVCFYSAVAYLALSIVMVIVIMGLKTDGTNYDYILSANSNWWQWVSYLMYHFITDAAVYIIAIFVGVGVIPTIFELATFVWPSEGLRGASDFFRGMNHYQKQTASIAVVAGGTAAIEGAKATNAVYNALRIDNDKKKAIAEINKVGKEDNVSETLPTVNESAHQESNQQQSAETWADKKWQEWVGEDEEIIRERKQLSPIEQENKRLSQLQEDLDGYIEAQQNGTVDKFLEDYNKRIQDNGLLVEIANKGYVALTEMSAKERKEFLQRHNLTKTFAKMTDLNMRMNKGALADTRTKAYDAFCQVDELLIGKAKTILQQRGISTESMGNGNAIFSRRSLWEELPDTEKLRKINEALDELRNQQNI